MADSILPALDIYASCPYDGKVLSHYAGVFSAVYIALSPFVQPDPGFHERYLSDLDVSRKEILAHCRAVPWKEIAQQCGLPDVAASLLWTVHWDSHFSFLCAASGSALKDIGVEAKLEGFFCDPETEVYSSLQTKHAI